jgi:soluble lytic murein transglycosylase-like protein
VNRFWPSAVLMVVALWVALLAVMVLVLLSTPAYAQTVDVRTPAAPAAAAPYRGTLVREAHSQWGLDAPVAALAAQVHAESAWAAGAVSKVGAVGLAQFMPTTASWWCSRSSAALADCQPTNPTWALRSMVGYDKWLYDRLARAGDEPDRLWAALRAYNGGLGHWVAEARCASSPDRAAVDAACGRASRAAVHCAENLAYPRRILLELQPRYSGWGRNVGVAP